MSACVVGNNFFMEVVDPLLIMAGCVVKSVVEDVELLLMMACEVMAEVVVVLGKIDITQFVETRAKQMKNLDINLAINLAYRC